MQDFQMRGKKRFVTKRFRLPWERRMNWFGFWRPSILTASKSTKNESGALRIQVRNFLIGLMFIPSTQLTPYDTYWICEWHFFAMEGEEGRMVRW